uniref:Putative e3 ubiquitin ligase vhl component von hippel-lindau tumor suppressor in s n=1 Tax=Xenopsylla cheopis TaxID=163159 RepID=A0A6M2DHK7_XENCH
MTEHPTQSMTRKFNIFIKGEENKDLVGIRSGQSKTKVFLRFTNCSNRIVAIFWIDYLGYVKLYKILKPLEFIDVNTFVGHPWIFTDIKTRERYIAEGQRIFYPQPKYKNKVELTSPENPEPIRINVKISPPLRNLKILSLMVLAKKLIREKDVEQLDLPAMLKQELKMCIILEHQFRYKNLE